MNTFEISAVVFAAEVFFVLVNIAFTVRFVHGWLARRRAARLMRPRFKYMGGCYGRRGDALALEAGIRIHEALEAEHGIVGASSASWIGTRLSPGDCWACREGWPRIVLQDGTAVHEFPEPGGGIACERST